MANKMCHEIKEKILRNTHMHIYHSIGKVLKEKSVSLFCSGSHRGSLRYPPKIVDKIRQKFPYLREEIFEDKDHKWKINQ